MKTSSKSIKGILSIMAGFYLSVSFLSCSSDGVSIPDTSSDNKYENMTNEEIIRTISDSFQLNGVEVNITGIRQDTPPKMESISYEIIVDTSENDHRLALLHDNVKKYGTVFNTIVTGTALSGIMRRAN